MKNRFILLLIIAIIGVTGCSKQKDESETIAQIRSREGMPVKYETVEMDDFSEYLTFKGKIEGKKSHIVYSTLPGRVSKIHCDVNAYVGKDEVVLEIPVDVQASQYRQIKESLDLTEKVFLRMQNLYNSGAISQNELDEIETKLKVSRANYDAIEKSVKVQTPISGKVAIMYAELDKTINPGDALFKVVDTSSYKVRLNVSENQISKLRKGQFVSAFWEGKELNGSIVKIANSLDDETNSFLVDIVLDNNGQKILTGVNSEIKVLIYKSKCITIADQYVNIKGNHAFIYLVNGTESLKREIVLGRHFDGIYEVLSGIKVGDKLITEGSRFVQDGTKIRVK